MPSVHLRPGLLFAILLIYRTLLPNPAYSVYAFSTSFSFPSITVEIIQGRVPPSDIFTATDAYVRLFVGLQYVGTTDVVDNQPAPKWNAKFRAGNVRPMDTIRFEIYDYDYFTQADELGVATTSIGDLLEEGERNGKILRLQYTENKEYLLVRITWISPSDCGLTVSEPSSVMSRQLDYDQEDAQETEFPWQASIQRLRQSTPSNESSEHICGATVLNARWLLTAAQCVYRLDMGQTAIYAALGNRVFEHKKSEVYRIQAAIVHPNFHSDDNRHDLALLRTESRINLSNRVNPVCLPTDSLGDEDGQSLHSAVLPLLVTTGWGHPSLGAQPQASTLKKHHFLLRSGQQCRALYERFELRAHWRPEELICALSTGTVGHKGDIGGPLIGYQGGRAYLVGVNSWRLPLMMRKISSIKREDDAQIPGTFVRVHHYLDWIETHAWY